MFEVHLLGSRSRSECHDCATHLSYRGKALLGSPAGPGRASSASHSFILLQLVGVAWSRGRLVPAEWSRVSPVSLWELLTGPETSLHLEGVPISIKCNARCFLWHKAPVLLVMAEVNEIGKEEKLS